MDLGICILSSSPPPLFLSLHLYRKAGPAEDLGVWDSEQYIFPYFLSVPSCFHPFSSLQTSECLCLILKGNVKMNLIQLMVIQFMWCLLMGDHGRLWGHREVPFTLLGL